MPSDMMALLKMEQFDRIIRCVQ